MVLVLLAGIDFLLSENHRFSWAQRLRNSSFSAQKAKKRPKMAIFPRQNLTYTFPEGAVFRTGRFFMCQIVVQFHLWNILTK